VIDGVDGLLTLRVVRDFSGKDVITVVNAGVSQGGLQRGMLARFLVLVVGILSTHALLVRGTIIDVPFPLHHWYLRKKCALEIRKPEYPHTSIYSSLCCGGIS